MSEEEDLTLRLEKEVGLLKLETLLTGGVRRES
jgi:hypothetical protein